MKFSKTRLVRIDERFVIPVLVQLVENKFFKEPGDNRQHRYWPIIRLSGFSPSLKIGATLADF